MLCNVLLLSYDETCLFYVILSVFSTCFFVFLLIVLNIIKIYNNFVRDVKGTILKPNSVIILRQNIMSTFFNILFHPHFLVDSAICHGVANRLMRTNLAEIRTANIFRSREHYCIVFTFF